MVEPVRRMPLALAPITSTFSISWKRRSAPAVKPATSPVPTRPGSKVTGSVGGSTGGSTWVTTSWEGSANTSEEGRVMDSGLPAPST